jgi:hypothetical protein
MLWTNKDEFQNVKPEVMQLMQNKVKAIKKEMSSAKEIKAITKDMYAVYHDGYGRTVILKDDMFLTIKSEYGDKPIGYIG